MSKNDTTVDMCRILTAAINQELHPEIVGKDIDWSGKDVFMPHLHQGLEIKLLGFLKKNGTPFSEGNWQTLKTIVIPAQVIHSSDRYTAVASILVEKNKLTCVCNGKMLPASVPPAAFADMGIAMPAFVNFWQSGVPAEMLSAQNAKYGELLLKTFLSALGVVLEQSFGAAQTSLAAGVVNYINRNYYRDNLSVEDVAAYLRVTPNYLVSRFRGETGSTIRRYLVSTRLEQAELLLRSGCYLVKDAAKLTGWNSAYYFSNCFRRHFGFPPSEISLSGNPRE